MEKKSDIDRIYEKLEKIDDKLNNFIGLYNKLETKVMLVWVMVAGVTAAKLKGWI
jgi:hypothetical protein